MKLITNTVVLCALIVLSGCSGGDTSTQNQGLSQEIFQDNFDTSKSVADLSDMGLSDFVTLNGLQGESEVLHLYVSNNDIDVLNISEYSDLIRLVADSNSFTFFNDIKFPNQIRHINLADNQLETLAGIENLGSLVSLNVSNNLLDEEDFKILAGLDSLRVIYAQGNDLSPDFLQRLDTFNAPYLRSIKGVDPTQKIQY